MGCCKTQPGAIPLLGSAPATARAGLSPALHRRDQLSEARDTRTAHRAREPAGSRVIILAAILIAAAGPRAGPGCLSNYNQNGQPDATKQANFNEFAKAVLARR